MSASTSSQSSVPQSADLLSRRRLMSGSLVSVASASVATLGVIEEAKAERDLPSWLNVPGEVVRSYGQPADSEGDVKRALI